MVKGNAARWRSSGKVISPTWHGESFFALELKVFGTTFGRCENSKPGVYFFPRFFALKREVWVCRGPQWIDQKLWSKVFRIFFHQKHWHWKKILFSAVQFFRARETARGPKKTLFLGWLQLGSLGLRGIPSRLSITAINPENVFVLRFLLGVQKKNISKFSVEPFLIDDPKDIFPGIKFWKIVRDSIVLRCSLWGFNASWDSLNQDQKKGKKSKFRKEPQLRPYTFIDFPSSQNCHSLCAFSEFWEQGRRAGG